MNGENLQTARQMYECYREWSHEEFRNFEWENGERYRRTWTTNRSMQRNDCESKMKRKMTMKIFLLRNPRSDVVFFLCRGFINAELCFRAHLSRIEHKHVISSRLSCCQGRTMSCRSFVIVDITVDYTRHRLWNYRFPSRITCPTVTKTLARIRIREYHDRVP